MASYCYNSASSDCFYDLHLLSYSLSTFTVSVEIMITQYLTACNICNFNIIPVPHMSYVKMNFYICSIINVTVILQ